MKGKIIEVTNNSFVVSVPFSDFTSRAFLEANECDVYFCDDRLISDLQRQAICATCKDIGDWTGNFELERYIQTLTFCELYDYEPFSLSRKSEYCASVTIAREFLTYLINICVVNGVPCEESLLKRAEDIGAYLYACVANRRCAICGGHADIHEVETVGMGRNRKTIHHEGQAVQPLCREHHREVGTIGQDSFNKKYHMQYIRLTKKLCEIINWKK